MCLDFDMYHLYTCTAPEASVHYSMLCRYSDALQSLAQISFHVNTNRALISQYVYTGTYLTEVNSTAMRCIIMLM